MKSLYLAVNAVAELSGPPLQERRLMLDFASRAEAAPRPGMDAALTGLMGASASGSVCDQCLAPGVEVRLRSRHARTAAWMRGSILRA